MASAASWAFSCRSPTEWRRTPSGLITEYAGVLRHQRLVQATAMASAAAEPPSPVMSGDDGGLQLSRFCRYLRTDGLLDWDSRSSASMMPGKAAGRVHESEHGQLELLGASLHQTQRALRDSPQDASCRSCAAYAPGISGPFDDRSLMQGWPLNARATR